MPRWTYRTPPDPTCPEWARIEGNLRADPVGLPVLDELLEDAERRHMRSCVRCQEHGAANIEVDAR